MRSRFFPAFLISITCQLVNSHMAMSQGAEQRITRIKMDHEDIETLLARLQEQTGLSFVLTGAWLPYDEKIDLPLAERTVKEVLDLVLQGKGLTYQIKKNAIIIHEDYGLKVTSITVSGRVLDAANQQPMAGVNVLVKGTTLGTSSDAGGRFALKATPQDVLVFTFIGYKNTEESINGRSQMDIILESDIANLNEIIISTGYWQTEEKLNPGNVAVLDAKEIQKQPVTNPLLALQGRISGVNIQQLTGVPGGEIFIQIRGKNSINSRTSSDPLYVINGVPYSSDYLGVSVGAIMQNRVSPLNSINPSDIESVQILKDADATAIYGSRGANGVVLINTKKGTSSKTSFEINFSSGFNQVAHFMDLLSTPQYVEMKGELLKSSASWPFDPVNYKLAPDYFLWDTTRYTDWQKKFIGGTGRVNNLQMAISGGAGKIRYRFSGSYHRENSVFPGNYAYQKASGLFTLSHTSADDRFTLALSTNYAIDVNELPNEDLTYQAVRLAPNAPALFDERGNINWQDSTWLNPMATYLKPVYRAKGSNLNTDINLEYKLLPGLSVKSNIGFNFRNLDQISINPKSSSRPDRAATFVANTCVGDGKINTWIIEPQLNYTLKAGGGTITFLLGASFQETIYSTYVINASGFTSDALMEDIKAASYVSIYSSDYYQYKYVSAYSRLNYNLEDKYILNLTARRDGSSRFGKNNKFGNFGAVGAAWIFSNEDFAKNAMGAVTFGKIRASLGTTGSDNIGNYQYLDSYTSTQNPYQGTSGLVPTRLANDDYGWETNTKLESGIEIGLWEDLLSFSISYYQNRASNQLIGYPLSTITGQPSVQKNFPATVQNTGWEFEFNTNILRKEFIWTAGFNLTLPKNKLLKYPDIEKSSYALAYEIGKPLSIYRGFRATGVNPLTGLYTYDDLNDDGKLDQEDLQIIGKIGQDYFLGITNSFSYKGFQLDFHIQAVKQSGNSYIQYFNYPLGYSGWTNNQPDLVMNRWQKPGDLSSVQKFGIGEEIYRAGSLGLSSSSLITDASFIRLKNVQLSWQVPTEWIQKAKIGRLNVYIQGQNMLTLTNYVGLDPENYNSNRLPPLRTVTLGVQLSF